MIEDDKNDHFGLQMLFMMGKFIALAITLMLICKLLIVVASWAGEAGGMVAVMGFIFLVFVAFVAPALFFEPMAYWFINPNHASNFQKLLKKISNR